MRISHLCRRSPRRIRYVLTNSVCVSNVPCGWTAGVRDAFFVWCFFTIDISGSSFGVAGVGASDAEWFGAGVADVSSKDIGMCPSETSVVVAFCVRG